MKESSARVADNPENVAGHEPSLGPRFVNDAKGGRFLFQSVRTS